MTESNFETSIDLVKELQRLAELFARHNKVLEAAETQAIIAEFQGGRPSST